TAVGQRADLDIVAEAGAVLDDYGPDLDAHERLQAIATQALASLERARELRDDLIAAIDEYRDFLKPSGAVLPLYDRGPVFDVLAPLIKLILDAGDTLLATELLAAWQ